MNKASERQARYDAAHTVRVSIKLNTTTDDDIIAWLGAQDSMQGAIKTLIRAEISRNGHERGHEAEETA